MAKKYNEIEVKDNMKVEEEDVTVEETSGTRAKHGSIVSAKPTKVKRSLFGRLVTGVVGPEGLPGIGSYVNDEIIKPAIKNIIVDAVTSGINMVMYGEKGGTHSRGRTSGYSGGRSAYRPSTNYSNNYRTAMQPVEPAERAVKNNRRGGLEDYVIPDRYEAAHVLTTLKENADRYGNVSVADYYDLIGIPSEYTDNNWGWELDTIVRATIMPIRGGFIIKFPPVEVLP